MDPRHDIAPAWWAGATGESSRFGGRDTMVTRARRWWAVTCARAAARALRPADSERGPIDRCRSLALDALLIAVEALETGTDGGR